MEKISDYGIYTDGMRKSMSDKTWFIDKIDGADCIVDYGCADGALLQYIRDSMPGVFDLIGIDVDVEMLHLAANLLNDGSNSPILLTQPKPFKDVCGESTYNSCLNCGSVIHEVYSYGSSKSIDKFWDFAFNSGFKYISIRDMAMSKIEISNSYTVIDDALRKISNYNKHHPGSQKRFNEFIHYIGEDRIEPDTWRSIVHYLLKYRYITNWDREMRENYLPLFTEEIILKIPNSYRVKYYEHYTLQYLKDRVMDDFGIDLNTKTHYKLLLERID